jgi:acyl-CoA thioester hydrolase
VPGHSSNRHVYECPLRWGDMDALGHVNNSRYVDYLQDARVDFLFRNVDLGGGDLETGLLVARHEVNYRTPLLFREAPVRIELWVSEIKAAWFSVDYEILDVEPERIVYVDARTKLVPFNFQANCPRRITPAERGVLEGLVAA